MPIKSTIECLYLDINDFVQRIDFTLLPIFGPITRLHKVKWTCLEHKLHTRASICIYFIISVG